MSATFQELALQLTCLHELVSLYHRQPTVEARDMLDRMLPRWTEIENNPLCDEARYLIHLDMWGMLKDVTWAIRNKDFV